MFAIVSYKGNQYKVLPDKEIEIALSDDLVEGKDLIFSDVLLIDDDKTVKVGTPFVEGASVTATVLSTTRGEKLTGIKFKAKKHYQRNLGHRQDYTLVKISSIKA